MRRRVFNILCATSLILCLASGCWWIGSCWRYQAGWYDSPSLRRTQLKFSMESECGWVMASLVVDRFNRDLPWSPFRPHGIGYTSSSAHGVIEYPRALGFAYEAGSHHVAYGDATETITHRTLRLPDWFLVVFFAIAPARWLVLWRR